MEAGIYKVTWPKKYKKEYGHQKLPEYIAFLQPKEVAFAASFWLSKKNQQYSIFPGSIGYGYEKSLESLTLADVDEKKSLKLEKISELEQLPSELEELVK